LGWPLPRVDEPVLNERSAGFAYPIYPYGRPSEGKVGPTPTIAEVGPTDALCWQRVSLNDQPRLINGTEVPAGVAVEPMVEALTGVLAIANSPVPNVLPSRPLDPWPRCTGGVDVPTGVPVVVPSALTGVFASTKDPPAFGSELRPTTTSSGVLAVVSEAGVPVPALPFVGALTVTSGSVSVEGIDDPDP